MSAGKRPGARARAQSEVEAGRPWRAKEILRGALSNPQFATDPYFLESFGRLLDGLGDRVEAGKMFYLSGRRTEEYAASIDLFLTRTKRMPARDFVAQLPGAIRHQGLGCLPEVVLEDLARRGVGIDELGRSEPVPERSGFLGEGRPGEMAQLAAAAFVLVFVSTWFIGCITVIQWVF